jgi:hypothetical protein
MKFKVGDKVRVIKETKEHHFIIGTEGRITKIYPDCRHNQIYLVEVSHYVAQFMREEELELVAPASPDGGTWWILDEDCYIQPASQPIAPPLAPIVQLPRREALATILRILRGEA